MLLDNPFGERHPKPQAIAFRRVKRLKDLFRLLNGHAASGISDLQQKVAAERAA